MTDENVEVIQADEGLRAAMAAELRMAGLNCEIPDSTLRSCIRLVAAALTTPAPADGTDPEDHSGQKLRETVEQELTRIEKRNSGRDQAPAFDRELARNVILAAFGLFDCPKDTTASGYQWMRLLTLLGLDKTAPAVSTDEIDGLLYSVTRMPLSNKAGELVRWRKETSDRLSAILSRLRHQ